LHVLDELAVGIEVVSRVLLPKRVAPDVERLAEAIDMLGETELRDTALGGDVEVAAQVLLGEELLGPRIQIVRTQMSVVVGEHQVPALGRSASKSSATRRSKGVVILRLSREPSTMRTSPPIASTSCASS